MARARLGTTRRVDSGLLIFQQQRRRDKIGVTFLHDIAPEWERLRDEKRPDELAGKDSSDLNAAALERHYNEIGKE